MTTIFKEAEPRDGEAAQAAARRTLEDEIRREKEKEKSGEKEDGSAAGATSGEKGGAAGGAGAEEVPPTFDREAARARLEAVAFGEEKDSKGSAIFDERETAVMKLDLRKLKKRKKDLDAAVKAAGVANVAALQELRDGLSSRRTKWIERTLAAEEKAWTEGRARETQDEGAKAAEEIRKAILKSFTGAEPWAEVNGLVEKAEAFGLVTSDQAALMRLSEKEIGVLAVPTKLVAVKRADWLVRLATVNVPPELALLGAIVAVAASKAWNVYQAEQKKSTPEGTSGRKAA